MSGINSLDDYIAAVKQLVTYSRTTSRTSANNVWFAVHDLAGNPGAATLAVGNTAAGLVPSGNTAGVATTGYPLINFSSGTGYLATVDFGNTVACRMTLYDRLFHCGAYAFNAATTLASQPSFSGRVPSGTDYTGLQIWAEAVTAGTGIQSVTVTYTNQAGTTGRTTGAVSAGVATTVGKQWQLPLQAGDSGVQKIESVTGTVATVGTFNVFVARPLWNGRVPVSNGGDSHGIDRIGLPQVWQSSAFALMVAADSSATGLPDLTFEIASN